MDITDVRKALLDAYNAEERTEGYVEGKSSEAVTEVMYPNWWEADSNSFFEPCQLMVYSYALGPSRRHYFIKSDTEHTDGHNTWWTRDIFAKAVEVINGWKKEIEEESRDNS